MSLDVYLEVDEIQSQPRSGRIFIRENGSTREISREEWDRLNPGREPVTIAEDVASREVFEGNVTHNLNRMAEAAGIYKQLWRPEEIGVTLAADLIEPLAAGLERLNYEPDIFKAYNPANGWGDYDGFVRFVERYLAACRRYPHARVTVSR